MEIGEFNFIEYFDHYEGEDNYMMKNFDPIHDNMIRDIQIIYPETFHEVGFFKSIFLWFISFFQDKKKEFIRNIGDLMRNLMDKNPKKRLDINSLIEILEEMKIFYQNLAKTKKLTSKQNIPSQPVINILL